jgi:hypothetical protein
MDYDVNAAQFLNLSRSALGIEMRGRDLPRHLVDTVAVSANRKPHIGLN